jgi:hypothetical protein
MISALILGNHLLVREARIPVTPVQNLPGLNHFVGKDGLYVSINNEFHPDFDESQLRYKVVQFDLEK